MLSWVLERCADLFGVTRRGSSVVMIALTLVVGCGLVAIVLARWGLPGAVPLVVLAVLAGLAAAEVAGARDRLWRVATLPLDDPGQHANIASGAGTAPTAMALNRLAVAVDSTRRARYAEAADLIATVARDLLRPDEVRLLEAVRSMIALGLGEAHRAAQIAAAALPTGSEELDAWLGRALVSDAWSDRARLESIDSAWGRAGIETANAGVLPKLRKLMRIRTSGGDVEGLPPREAQELSNEARAIGDDDLAVQLDAAGRRSGTYR